MTSSGLKTIVIGLILTGLFAFALMSAGYLVGFNNHANRTILDDVAFSDFKTQLEGNLSSAYTDANSSLENLGDSPISGVLGATIFDSIGGVWKTIKVVPVAIFNLVVGTVKERIFGEGYGVVFLTVSAIIIILILLAVVKFVISGQDE